jgi:uncharacterized SAM-binding protein YcdF (DUF218 family)
MIQVWEVGPPKVQELQSIEDPVPYAVVLGGMTEYTGYAFEPYQLLDAADRLMAGLRLIKEGYTDTILLSGGSNPLREDPEPSEALLMRDWVQTFTDVDPSAIRIEPHSVNTYGNAKAVKAILEKEGKGKRIYLVTSAYHMRRARMVFRKVGLNPIPVATDHRSAKKLDEAGIMNWIPSSSALHYSSEILREIMGYAYYKLMF